MVSNNSTRKVIGRIVEATGFDHYGKQYKTTLGAPSLMVGSTKRFQPSFGSVSWREYSAAERIARKTVTIGALGVAAYGILETSGVI